MSTTKKRQKAAKVRHRPRFAAMLGVHVAGWTFVFDDKAGVE